MNPHLTSIREALERIDDEALLQADSSPEIIRTLVDDIEAQLTSLEKKLEGAVEAEREAIAKIIMTIDNTYLGPQYREKLATAIRNRGAK